MQYQHLQADSIKSIRSLLKKSVKRHEGTCRSSKHLLLQTQRRVMNSQNGVIYYLNVENMNKGPCYHAHQCSSVYKTFYAELLVIPNFLDQTLHFFVKEILTNANQKCRSINHTHFDYYCH